MFPALALPPAYDTLSGKLAALSGDHRVLAFAVIGLEVHHDPVVGFIQLVRPRSVREKDAIVMPIPSRVKYREPCFVFRIEPPRGDLVQGIAN